MTFQPTAYSKSVQLILGEGNRISELGPGQPNRTIYEALMSFEPLKDLGPIRDASMASACSAGLWLYHDFLDESHQISQEISTSTGSYWHAIMHRREPDAWNSKYWWKRVGTHPVITQLRIEAANLGFKNFDPIGFVDFCESVRGTGRDEEQLAQRIQLVEWQLLFDYCYRHAVA